ncbi:uncharacterized protein LOC124809177 [Hydra vulgaris]|uniref:uncharacterized protein LOC124809177 n=1 Tax=Hydra vulgaris TaxID=6087 RepID=UPI001F5ED4CA|nr:uncharacterized protein LOC124809177 [Hydra vulgaris]
MEESISIPGLVQPYTNNNEILANALKSKENRIDANLVPYPYSIYDDDSSTDHYFLVPGSKVDICRFKREFIHLNDLKRTQLKESIYANNSTHHHREEPICANKTTNQLSKETIYTNTSNVRYPLINKQQLARKNLLQSSGEYCLLAQDDKKYFSHKCQKSRLNNNNNNKEDKKLSGNFYCLHSETERLSKSNSFHSRHKSYDTILQRNDKKLQKQLKKEYHKDNFIDSCTCIVCVKAINYHFDPDDTNKTIETCSCSGNLKSISRRWFCLGVLSVFFPCLLCYIPLKLCQKEPIDIAPKTKLKNAHEVRYVKGPYFNATSTSL